MSDWLEQIVEKVKTIQKLDPQCKLFGAHGHKYRFGPVLTQKGLAELENRYCVQLPEDYRQFLLRVGNGGCGPGYGLERFGDDRLLATAPEFAGTGVMHEVVSMPNYTISVEEIVDRRGQIVDRFDIGFFDAIRWLCKDPARLRRPFPLTHSVFKYYPEKLSAD